MWNILASCSVSPGWLAALEVAHPAADLNYLRSKSVAELKTKYPALEESIKGVLTYQMERLVDEER